MTNDQLSGQPVHHTSDSELHVIKQAQAGESTAIEILFQKYNEMLVFSILKRIRDSGLGLEDAENLASETWIKVLAQINNYDPNRGPFGYWLINLIAFQVATDHIRKKVRRNLIENSKLLVFFFEYSQPTLAEIEFKLGEKAVLAQALEELSDVEQQMLVAYYVEEKTLSEVAQDFQLTNGQTRGRIFRIKQKLRELIQNLLNPTSPNTQNH